MSLGWEDNVISLLINAILIQGWPRTDKIPHECILEVSLVIKTSEGVLLLKVYLPVSGQIPRPLYHALEINLET